MNTDPTVINKLQTLGYSASQASFLWLVALHSGVFLRRQYLQFAGISSGKHATSFLGRLIEIGHCRTAPLAGKISVYHLHSKAIYRTIGHPELRFRRPHGLDYVKTKLLSLDFVLQNTQNTYLTTEQKKVEFFTHYCNVPLSALPGRVYRSTSGKSETIRYFVDKFPLFLSPAAVVHFTFVSAGGLPRLEEFRSHLLVYSKLFRHLKEVRLVYIHQDSFHISQAEACFHAMLSSPDGRHIESPGLLRYFQLRQAWEREEYEKVDSEGLIYLDQSRRKYAGCRYESLYQDWKNQAVNDKRSAGRLNASSPRGHFLSCPIKVDPRTFMVTTKEPTSDKLAKTSFQHFVHPLCHPDTLASEWKSGS